MRKSWRRLVSLVLTLAMVFSLTGTAWAAEMSEWLDESDPATTEVVTDESAEAAENAADDETAEPTEDDVADDVAAEPTEVEEPATDTTEGEELEVGEEAEVITEVGEDDEDDKYVIGPGIWSDQDPYFTEDCPKITDDWWSGLYSFFSDLFSPRAEVPYSSYEEVYQAIAALQSKYPEGMRWTNFEPYGPDGDWGDSYLFLGGPIKGAQLGRGCAAHNFLFSDTIFPGCPLRVIDNDYTEDFYDRIQVGDFLRIGSHFVMVWWITDSGIIVAEGNFNSSVHWGRVISRQDVIDQTWFFASRYPKDHYFDDDPTRAVASSETTGAKAGNLDWALTASGILTVSGNDVMPDYTVDNRPPWELTGNPIYSVVVEDGVRSIGANAFCKTVGNGLFVETTTNNVMSMSVAGSVKSVGNNAFRGCDKLTALDLAEGIETFGDNAIAGCTALKAMDFPASTRKVGSSALASCQELRQVRFIPNANGTPVEIGSNLFSQCWNLQFVSLPQGMTTIPAGMFASCQGVVYLYLPRSLTSLAEVGAIGGDPFTSGGIGYCPVGTVYFGGTEAEWNSLMTKLSKAPSLGATYKALSNATVECEKDDPFVPLPDDPGDIHFCEGDTHYGTEDAEGNCTNCGQPWSSSGGEPEPPEPPEECEHVYSEWVIDAEPTTEQTGSKHRDCELCGDRQTEEIPKLTKPVDPPPVDPPVTHQHSWMQAWNSNAEDHWHECANSGCPITSNSSKNGYGQHEFGDFVIDVEPTTEEAGSQHRDCEICNYRQTEEIPKLTKPVDPPPVNPPEPPAEHECNWSELWSSDANDHWHECLAPDCPITDNREKDGYGQHEFGNLIVDVAATATVAGSGHKVCEVCAYRVDETIPATGGSTTNPVKPGTTTNPGGTTRPGGTTTTRPGGSTVTKPVDPGNVLMKPDGSTVTVVTKTDGSVETEVKLPTKLVQDAVKRGEPVELQIMAVNSVRNAANAPTVTIRTEDGGAAKVAIPVTATTAGTVAMLVKADGSTEVIKTSVATNDSVIVSVPSGTTVKIVENDKEFADVSAEAWYSDAVDFVSAHELFAGVGEGRFASDGLMTRGMLMTVLARYAGAETEGGATWYEKSVTWAQAQGISDGSNPDGSITREQLVTMLWRYAGSPKADMSLAGYTDTDQISGYAEEAMQWAVQNGILSGFGNGLLGPRGLATRAQVAQILRNFIRRTAL